jgi:hypothetical protein
MSFKTFNLDEDVFSNEYFSTELIRISNFYFSGTDQPVPNYKFYNHYYENSRSGSFYCDIFDKRYDDPFSNKLLSFTFGYTSSSIYFTGSGFAPTYQSQKTKMYRLFAKRLLGSENRVFKINERVIENAIFISLARNQYRDQVKAGEIAQISYWGSGTAGTQNSSTDLCTSLFYNVNIAQDYCGPFSYNLLDGGASGSEKSRMILYQNAGAIVIDADSIDNAPGDVFWSGTMKYDVLAKGVSGSTFNDLLWGIKHRLSSIIFNSSQKVASTFLKCTAAPSEFNYSSNPSFVDQSQAIITALSATTPTVYFTQVGLANRNGEILAVAKLKQPVKKHPEVGVSITVRLDY